MALRKIVQIAGVGGVALALCNDGTLWSSSSREDGWRKLKDIPQPEDRESKSHGAVA